MVMPCGFESHLSHQKIQIPIRVSGFFNAQMGLETAAPVRRLVQKVSGGHFLARGRVHERRSAVRRTVKLRSFKEAKSTPIGGAFFGYRCVARKGGTSPQTGAKSVRWTLF